ncbi:MAG TPA: hypothetical protein VJ596_04120, partial [Gemmatimonadaceae bacterium]|nr:hypothetical protein [Gemmatimonadaceae bacterium]
VLASLILAQPAEAQARAGGMRVYAGRSAPRATPNAARASGPRLYERRFPRRSRHHVQQAGRFRDGKFHRGKSAVFFSFPFGWFPFDPWLDAPSPVAQPAYAAARPPGPSKVIEVTRSPAGVELRVRYADDRHSIIPVTDTLVPGPSRNEP